MASNTYTPCQGCGGIVDHRSAILKRSGNTTIRKCIHCGYEQRCQENIISDQNARYIEFLEKLMGSPKADLEDGLKAKWLRDMLTQSGYVPTHYLGEFRRLQKKYDTQI